MNSPHEYFARASEWLWAAMADHLWQATLFAALVCAVALLVRRGPARLRYALWLVASAKFVVPSALFAFLAAGIGVEASWLSARPDATTAGVPVIFQLAVPVSALNEAGGAAPSAAAHASEFYCALSLIWLLGCASLLAVWLKRRREFMRAAAEGREAYSGREFEAMERARRRLGLGRDVMLLLSPRGVEPGVWRTRRPVILLPESIAEHLDEEELESLMLHELVHVERRDNALSNLQMALSCVFWFHPLVWFLSRRLMAEREQACDERVLEVGGVRGSYAASILKVVRFCFGWKVAGVSGAAAGSNLRRRIEKIMHEQKNPKASRWQRVLPATAATLALAFTAGAGVLSHLRGGAARAQDSSQVRARSAAGGQGQRMGVRASARTQAGGGGPATQEILNAPESVVYFEHVADAPLVITDAKLKMITREQLRRADEEGADYFDEEEKAEFLVTLPTVTVTNVSGKEIKEVGVGFVKDGRVHVVMGYRAALKPGEAQTFRPQWNQLNMIMPGTFADVSVKVVWAIYADGTDWGVHPRVPHPPQAPPPPPPGATFRRTPAPVIIQGGGAGDEPQPIVGLIEMGDGRGAGRGAGRGGGVGTGQGEGVGAGGGEGGGRGAIQAGGLNGKAVSLPQPVYPAVARVARAQGMVTVRITVDEGGTVIEAEAVSGHPLLRSAAEEAARSARFSPTRLSGKPVKVAGQLAYNFIISGGEIDPQ